jgi:predicted MPP superfamily phosphohydrolase
MPASFDENTFVDTTHLELAHPWLPREFDGFSAVALSDLHLSQWVRLGFVRRMLDMIAELQPTILLLLGDLVEHSGELSEIVGREIAGLCARIPTYAVLGNHEYYWGPEASVQAWRQAGMNLLINQSCLIGPDGKPVDSGPRIALVGLDDIIQGELDPAQALADVPEEMYTILLTHSPDAADDPRLHGQFMFAGHTHGGQIRLLGHIIRTETRNRRYGAGLVQGPKFPLYITRGLGINGLPFRLDCPPELVKVTLRSGG